ncbi:periplasmic solute binding protein [Halothece sp. PCC 7418]|uniref:metal ABC transporter solute-binding protein, Zn/Mn family n=1 Tax=Halothece sp. (strain PCC 7418) TaxID=65093 RepID=UPI0002A07126|nr:zinc ABC transporter substrate-binding protein [Halothece sp. PCC 7418]AFZ45711.1 periplasmic solute binding protein [Halothece sp. PCC 7418]
MITGLFHKPWLAMVGVITALVLSSCSDSPPPRSREKPSVVTTSTMITDWTKQVGGDEIKVIGILEPGADPHVYEPVPADSRAMEQADLIFYNGYNLEPELIKLMQGTGISEEKTFAVAEVITPFDYDYDGQRVPDPHVWGDAENAIVMVNAIRDQLIELSPEDEAEFRENAAEYTKQLEELDSWMIQQIQTIPADQRQLVTTHDAFQYYARAYGLDVTGTLIGISTEEQPSAQTVKNLSDAVQNINVPAIFAETTINPALIKTVANEAGVTLAQQELYSDSIGAPNGEANSYLGMLIVNTRTIVQNLEGSYTPFANSINED